MEKAILLSSIFVVAAVACMAAFHRHGHLHGKGARKFKPVSHKHGSWLSIDYFAYSSKLRPWNAVFKVLFSIVIIILCIALNHMYVSAVVILAMMLLVVGVGGLGLREYLSVLAVPLTFILISILAIVVDFSKHPASAYRLYIGFGYLYTTAAMLKSGVALLLKIFAAISALQMMILTTPSSEIISVLRFTHVPKGFLDLMNMIYRYIFILLEVFAKMKDSAESRLGYRDFKTACSTFGGVASNLLVVSLKKAGAYYDAMEARCYDGELRFLEEEKKLEIRLILPAAAFIAALLLLWILTK